MGYFSIKDSIKLPESWKDFYRSVEPSMVRGGIIGQSYDETCIDFDKTHSKFLNMNIPGLHILNIRPLTERFKMPFAPIPAPEIEVFRRSNGLGDQNLKILDIHFRYDIIFFQIFKKN